MSFRLRALARRVVTTFGPATALLVDHRSMKDMFPPRALSAGQKKCNAGIPIYEMGWLC